MPLYNYKALNPAGHKVSGQLFANNDADLYQRLKLLRLELIKAREDKGQPTFAFLRPKIRNIELIQTCLHLQQLSAAGVSLMDGLADVRDATDHRGLRDLLAEIFEDVSQGQSLSAAFGRHPRVFGTVFQSLIAAGEESGNLTESFGQLIKHLRWINAINTRIRKATRYPSVMMVVMLGLFLFMMMFVVPQVVGFLKENGQELPMVTLALIATSEFVQDFWWGLIGGPIALFVILRLAVRQSEDLAYKIDSGLLRLPVLGDLFRKIALSRFAHFFATMFQSGVPILTCIETARKVVGNRCLAASLESVRRGVEDGNPLSQGLRNTGEFPNLVVRLVRIGEESGNLGETLDNVTGFYDAEVNESIDGMIVLIEPALTVFAGLMMAWIAVAVFGPIYASLQSLSS